MEKNFASQNYFDYEEYIKLFDVISADKGEFADEDADAVKEAVDTCLEYVNFVDCGENRIKRASVNLQCGDINMNQFQLIASDYDKSRHNKHEVAIGSANMLNRLAERYGCGKIYNGSADRLEVADFCLEVTVALFQNRTK